MSNLNFQERFKGRSAFVSNYGSVDINTSNIITKAKSDQIHTSILKSAGTSVVTPSYASPVKYKNKSEVTSDTSSHKAHSEIIEPLKSTTRRSNNHSSIPITKKISSKGVKSVNKSHSISDYKPYTLMDYQIIKPKKYYQLGGLGPSNIGTEEWNKKKELIDKRWKYGKDIYYMNASKIPLFPYGSPVKLFEKDSRTKALEFAKRIIKPPLRHSII